MNRAVLALVPVVLAACGDNALPRLSYTNPPPGGALRLIAGDRASASRLSLSFVVGDQPVTGYAVGFDLPLAPDRVQLASFTAGRALDAGASVPSAMARIPYNGPLANNLVTAQSQQGATDTELAPGSVLFSLELVAGTDAPEGVVFDGIAAEFLLPSGGMRARSGTTVVAAPDVAIGRLELGPQSP